MQRPLQSIDGVVAGGEGVLPHPNVEHWVRRTTTTHRSLSPDDVGVIAGPHGSEYNWNETMREGQAPLTDDHTIPEAFSMVDPPVIERAVRDLEATGVKAAVMIRIFSMESNFKEKAHYVLGLLHTFGRSIMGERLPERICTHLQMTTLGGLAAPTDAGEVSASLDAQELQALCELLAGAQSETTSSLEISVPFRD